MAPSTADTGYLEYHSLQEHEECRRFSPSMRVSYRNSFRFWGCQWSLGLWQANRLSRNSRSSCSLAFWPECNLLRHRLWMGSLIEVPYHCLCRWWMGANFPSSYGIYAAGWWSFSGDLFHFLIVLKEYAIGRSAFLSTYTDICSECLDELSYGQKNLLDAHDIRTVAKGKYGSLL